MYRSFVRTVVLFLNLWCATELFGQLVVSPAIQGFSAIKGNKGRTHTISITNNSQATVTLSANIAGDDATYFSLRSGNTHALESEERSSLKIAFQPPSEFVGTATAVLQIVCDGQPGVEVVLNGLGTKGLEGKNEPPLADVLNTLGVGTDVGWKTLANHVKPERQGEEIQQTLFRKAGTGNVEIVPLARYSPSFRLPFGYYTQDGELHQVGVLSEQKQPIPEHQTLHPALEEGATEFDPKEQSFGIFTSSPTHDAFSQDSRNRAVNQTSAKRHAVHACRTYPARDVNGDLQENQYLFCFEEAFNGDYQDYVFLVRNIQPISETGD